MASLGFVVGMVGGGWITEFVGWRWVYFVNVPVALVALLAAPAAITESRDEEAPRVLDLPGAITVTLGLASLIYAVSEIPDSGWGSPATLGFGGLGAVLLSLFILAEHRSPAPLVPLQAFGERALVGPNVGIFLQSMVGLPWLYVLTLYLQDALGRSPMEAGLLFLPMTLTGVVAASVAGRLVARIGARAMASSGLALSAVGLLLTMGMSSDGGLSPVLSGMVVGEVGFMFCNVALTIVGSGGAGEDRKGLSAGLLNTSIQLGNAWGLGIVATVVAAATVGGEAASPEALVEGLRLGALTCVGFATLALPVVLFGLRDKGDRQ